MTDRWILAIADDLTGALEVGARFSGYGLESIVTTTLSVSARPAVPVLVVDTETRHESEDTAEAIVRVVAKTAYAHAPWLIYKKTDSTLRGNIAAELRAVLKVFREKKLIYAPAYPALGRTVRNGHLLVNGVPVHQTEFARDPLNPIRTSRVEDCLRGVPAIVTVIDGESTEHIRAVAQQVITEDPTPLVAGTGALAGELASLLGAPVAHDWPRVRRCLVVNGSLHPASLSQIEYAQASGCFTEGWDYFGHESEGVGMARALQTGESVRQRLERSPVDALIVFGGDTAFGIHQALGAVPFRPYAEIVPGVPLSRCGDLFWITKAGGFGAPDLLCEIRRTFT